MAQHKAMMATFGMFTVGLVSGGVLVAQILIREQAPTERAVHIPLADIEATMSQMEEENRSTVRFIEGGRFNLNIRRITTAESALMHPTTNDVYVVREGTGTLVTGGVMIDENGAPVNGPRAAAIRGGVEQEVNAGDLVFIPAGLPHGFRDTDGITWFNIRFD